ncbi:hypothetical protein LCGC14_2587610 [marine sediment metagenome]|uniref:Uncharacterized protein n=1 Tax=marine sediment metagenome TaxID=412755 RepID=A0A0F9AD08_9ZZZZ
MGQNKRKQRTAQLYREWNDIILADHIKMQCADLAYSKTMITMGCVPIKTEQE